MKLHFVILYVALLVSPLPSTVIAWKEAKVDSEGTRQLLKGSTAVFESFEVTGQTLNPGSKATMYVLTDDEEMVIIKEGSLDVTIGGSTQTLGPGSVAYVMAGDDRGYAHAGKTAAQYYHLRFHSAKVDKARGAQGGKSFVRDWTKIENQITEKGFRRNFFNTPTAMCTKFEMHVTTLKEGLSSHAPHTHPEEEIILMVRGQAEIEIDGKRHPIAPGTLSYVASGIPHALHNTGKGESEYFAFQWK